MYIVHSGVLLVPLLTSVYMVLSHIITFAKVKVLQGLCFHHIVFFLCVCLSL